MYAVRPNQLGITRGESARNASKENYCSYNRKNMKFNICIVQPNDYIHVLAFWELAELIHYSLAELGHESHLQFKRIENDCTNIVLGCHLLGIELIPKMPASTIFINTEQIYADDTAWNNNIYEWARNFQFWDYSQQNIAKFNSLGISNVKLLQLGFQKELSRIKKDLNPDIDVLFYGSINVRRQKIIDELRARGLEVKSVFGVYGKERDELIARSKVVLNHHFYKSEIFEIVRVFYLLSNSVAVVGEVNSTTSIDSVYREAICATPYEGLVDFCEKISLDNLFREEVEQKGFQEIYKLPQSIYTNSLLS
jgi:hypothetical protein